MSVKFSIILDKKCLPDNLLFGVLLEWEAVGAKLVATAEDYHVVGTLQD